MMNIFSRNTDQKPHDVKLLRHLLLQNIKEQLGKNEGGEGKNIRALELFLSPGKEEKQVYEAAVYFDDPDQFKNEILRIADDYALKLPPEWTVGINFVDSLPGEAAKIPGVEGALFIRTRTAAIKKTCTAYLRILNGKAEQEVYTLRSTEGKINIGREKKVLCDNGFFRVNSVVFPAGEDESNRYISRQHAHIEWNDDAGQFYLYADEGGVPPANKVKVRTSAEETPVKLYSTHIGHALNTGDQIMLGESAILEFKYSVESNHSLELNYSNEA